MDNIEKAKAKRMKIKNQEPLNIKMKKQDFYKAFQEIEKYDCACKTPLLELIKIYPEKLKEVVLTVTVFFLLKLVWKDSSQLSSLSNRI
ncbi:MAG: hypothetical protein E7Y34_02355 [Mycoplasma sp.]|nr:hypothetical protein [Mycoplasma sp.]